MGSSGILVAESSLRGQITESQMRHHLESDPDRRRVGNGKIWFFFSKLLKAEAVGRWECGKRAFALS
jgi:hypothetical protein